MRREESPAGAADANPRLPVEVDNEDLGFNRTVIPVELARHGDDNLVSRSQAKRLLAQVEQFKLVIARAKAHSG